jgi:hypothetical protein
MSKCQNCGIEIEQKGNRTKLYCSDKCRMAYKRADERAKTNVLPEQVGNEHPQSEQTIKKGISRTGLNYDWNEVSPTLGLRKVPCSGCGEPVWEAGNPCLDCTNKVIESKKKGEELPNWYQDQTLG